MIEDVLQKDAVAYKFFELVNNCRIIVFVEVIYEIKSVFIRKL